MKANCWFLVSVVLCLLLISSLVTGGFGLYNKIIALKAGEIVNQAIEFINENKDALTGGTEVSLVEDSPRYQSGLYEFKIDLNGNQFLSYISTDGKLLFPNVIDIEEVSKQKQAEEQEKEKALSEIPKTEKPEVHLFVMAYCPYGNQAEQAMIPVARLLKDKADIHLNSVIYSNYATNVGGQAEDWCLSEDEKYCSMHGINELKQDIRELCVAKYQPEYLWDFVEKIDNETNVSDVEEKWESIAQELGIDVKKIKNCQEKEAESLLEEQVELNNTYQITGSPTLLINGVRYQGERTPQAYKEAICRAFLNPPEECNIQLGEGEVSASSAVCD
ncbi:thioredoxin domain-containing protein [bacterium]|nr:thioredoxin domain-containing protein [bacterium]